MLGIDTKVVRTTWSVVVTLVGLAFFYAAREALLIFIFAIFLAYMMAPLVAQIQRLYQGRLSRTLSLSIAYLLILAVLATGVTVVVSNVSQEAASLVGQLPELAERASNPSTLPLPSFIEPFREEILQAVKPYLQGSLDRFIPILKATLGHAVSLIGNLAFVLIVPILSFMFLKDAPEIRESLLAIATKLGKRPAAERLSNAMHRMLGQYILALVTLSGATFVVSLLFFMLAGVPYPALLATVGAVLELIPVAGPLAAAVISCIVAAVTGYNNILLMVGFFLLFRLVQDYVLQPMLYSSGVKLHPLLVMFGAISGEQVGGIVGMILSVPLMATFRLIVDHALSVRKDQ